MNDDGHIRVTLRLPISLHERLTAVAADASRSLNGEIVQRLEASFQAVEKEGSAASFDQVAAEIDAATKRMGELMEMQRAYLMDELDRQGVDTKQMRKDWNQKPSRRSGKKA